MKVLVLISVFICLLNTAIYTRWDRRKATNPTIKYNSPLLENSKIQSPIQEKVKANNNIFFVGNETKEYTQYIKKGSKKGFKYQAISALPKRVMIIKAKLKSIYPWGASLFFINKGRFSVVFKRFLIVD